MKRPRFIIAILFLLWHLNPVHAQEKFTDNLKLSLNLQRGYGLPEYSFISYFTDKYVSSVEINLMKETYGKNPWEKLYTYPEIGLSALYTTLGNDSLFGRAFALNYFFKLKIINKEKFNFYNRTGIGIGYLTEHFDLVSNRSNVAIGSHLNVHFSFKLGLNYRLSQKILLNSGISFDHFSNANIRDPNRGLNNVTGFVGASYYLGKQNPSQAPVFDSLVKHNYLELFACFGGKQPRSISSVYFLTSSLSFSWSRSFFRAVHFGVGADIFYDSAVPEILKDKGRTSTPMDVLQTGFHISQQFIYNRFRILLQEGVYVVFKNQIYNRPIYTKAIAQYAITDRFSVRISMKSHLHILDYPELGFGFKL